MIEILLILYFAAHPCHQGIYRQYVYSNLAVLYCWTTFTKKVGGFNSACIIGSVNNIYADESYSFFIDVINGEARLELEWYFDIEIELASLLDNISGSIDFLNTMNSANLILI